MAAVARPAAGPPNRAKLLSGSVGAILNASGGVLIALGTLAILAILPRLAPTRGALPGRIAPPFSMEVAANGDIGRSISLADLKGHPVVLDFWASWCGPCALEAPVVSVVARRFLKHGVVVVGVNGSDPPDVIRAYAASKHLGYPMVLDVESRVAQRYGVDRLPTLVIIDKAGEVHAFVSGLVDESGIAELLLETL